MTHRFHTFIAVTLLLAAAFAFAPGARAQAAGGDTSLPEWDRLTPAQREAMVAPMRERWNRDPGERARMLERAARWQAMTPEQRQRARSGMRRWEHMSPERREQMRDLFERTRGMPRAQRRETLALFHAMRGMTPEQRDALKREWSAMSPDQRAQWMRDHAPRRRGFPHRGSAGHEAPPRD